MSWIRNTVAIAAAIVLFFLMTTPVANSNMESQSMSSLKNDLINKLIPKDSNIAPATPVLTPKKDKVAEDALKTEERTDSTQHISMPEDNRYCIVLASQVRKDNAELFTKQMREKGFKDTNVYIYNNVVRVVYGHFKTESDAYAELHKHRFDADFEEAWVYKRKTEG
jgi:cell division septation protein DedD